jgi:[CysO sulfur-carrier protein]-S-L-cysteine hydrolase
VRISQQLIDEIIAHAREEAPNECCGMIGGKDGVATSVHRVANEFASPLRFRMESGEQIKTWNAIEAAGEEMVGIYHSHTSSPARPSQTDINESEMWESAIHVIASLEDPDRPAVRAFWIRDKKDVEEEPLDVV